MYIYIRKNIHVCIYIYIGVYLLKCLHTNIYMNVHTYIDIYILVCPVTVPSTFCLVSILKVEGKELEW